MNARRMEEAARHELQRVEARLEHRRPKVSPLVDADGRQYVDLVLEGGMYRALALVGFAYTLEHFGFRFLSLAGTSAGANIATLLAAAGRPHEPRAAKVLHEAASFGPEDAFDRDTWSQRKLADWLAEQAPGRDARLRNRLGHLLRGIAAHAVVVPGALWNLGAFPGAAFESWSRAALGRLGIHSTGELRARMQPVKLRGNPRATLCVVATDLSAQRRVVFPEDGRLYFSNPDAVHPAVWVRASIALPLLYRPLVASPPHQSLPNWNSLGHDEPPRRCLLVDGGLSTSFPVAVLHESGARPCPTVGVRVTRVKGEREITNVVRLLRQCLAASLTAGETAVLERDPEIRRLVGTIDTSAVDGNALSLSEDQAETLVRNGVRAAGDWLERLDALPPEKLTQAA